MAPCRPQSSSSDESPWILPIFWSGMPNICADVEALHWEPRWQLAWSDSAAIHAWHLKRCVWHSLDKGSTAEIQLHSSNHVCASMHMRLHSSTWSNCINMLTIITDTQHTAACLRTNPSLQKPCKLGTLWSIACREWDARTDGNIHTTQSGSTGSRPIQNSA